ncbi:hypothetical protein ACLOJK_005970 [Asimina triloba]
MLLGAENECRGRENQNTPVSSIGDDRYGYNTADMGAYRPIFGSTCQLPLVGYPAPDLQAEEFSDQKIIKVQTLFGIGSYVKVCM